MDQFLPKLNLQNLLRQFCCGVVFFIPLYLFVTDDFNRIWEKTKIGDDSLICVALLSFIIGTVIYHLEKNLYSYLIQTFFEGLGFIFLGCVFCIFLVGSIMWGIIGLNLPALMGSLLVMFVVACLICILLPILSKDFNSNADDDPTDRLFCRIVNRLIVRTEYCWLIEEKADGVNTLQHSIARRVSVWADFVHCVQSSCFSWILGSIAAYYLHHARGGVCNIRELDMRISIIIAIFILLVEIGIDAHRYIHVKRMTTYYACWIDSTKTLPITTMACRRCYKRKECFMIKKRANKKSCF